MISHVVTQMYVLFCISVCLFYILPIICPYFKQNFLSLQANAKSTAVEKMINAWFEEGIKVSIGLGRFFAIL